MNGNLKSLVHYHLTKKYYRADIFFSCKEFFRHIRHTQQYTLTIGKNSLGPLQLAIGSILILTALALLRLQINNRGGFKFQTQSTTTRSEICTQRGEYYSNTDNPLSPSSYFGQKELCKIGREASDIQINTNQITWNWSCSSQQDPDLAAVTCNINNYYCGDGVVDPQGKEECDPSARNQVANEGAYLCSNTCTWTHPGACGELETVYDGNRNGDALNNGSQGLCKYGNIDDVVYDTHLSSRSRNCSSDVGKAAACSAEAQRCGDGLFQEQYEVCDGSIPDAFHCIANSCVCQDGYTSNFVGGCVQPEMLRTQTAVEQKYYCDLDNDGFQGTYYVAQAEHRACTWEPQTQIDCYDSDRNIYPGATEICDQQDNNCNGYVDEDRVCEDITVYYCDVDGDGYYQYGEGGTVPAGCATHVPDDPLDCDDNDSSVSPGPDTPERCADGLDNNCNQQIDENCSCEDPDIRDINMHLNSGVHQLQSCDEANALYESEIAKICDSVMESKVTTECDQSPQGHVQFQAQGEILCCNTTKKRACKLGDIKSCSTGLPGVCSNGVQTCKHGQRSSCDGTDPEETEICGDLLDNNCNNSVDEGCPGSTPKQSTKTYPFLQSKSQDVPTLESVYDDDAAPIAGTCIGAIPKHATLCETDADDLHTDIMRKLVARCGLRKCEYTCDQGYSYDNVQRRCTIPQQEEEEIYPTSPETLEELIANIQEQKENEDNKEHGSAPTSDLITFLQMQLSMYQDDIDSSCKQNKKNNKVSQVLGSIDLLSNYCIIKGYTNKQKKAAYANASTTKAEFIKMLTKIDALDYDIKFIEGGKYSNTLPYNDIQSKARYVPYVIYAHTRGRLENIGKTTSKGTELKALTPINTQEVLTILENVGITDLSETLESNNEYITRKEVSDLLVDLFQEKFTAHYVVYGNNAEMYTTLINQLNKQPDEAQQLKVYQKFLTKLTNKDPQTMEEEYNMHLEGMISFLQQTLTTYQAIQE